MTASAVAQSIPGGPASPADFLDAALSRVSSGAVVCVSVPAPLAAPEALLRAAPGEDAFLWHTPEGATFSALAAAETLRAEGPDRIGRIRRQAEALFASIETVALGEAPPAGPRCFGGFSFDPGSAAAAPWTAFGDARFVLPRFTYCISGDRAWLTIAARHDEVDDSRKRAFIVTWAESLLGALRSPASQPPAALPWEERKVVERLEMSTEDWSELVGRVRQRIAAGEFEKVVVARKSVLRFEAPVAPWAVLETLERSADPSTRFAVRVGGTTFLGSTPERLVRVRGLEIDTEALAGSSRPGDSERAAELLESAKERLEHGPVLREIVSALEPYCTELDYPKTPEVRALEHIFHLRTPVHGRLKEPVHVLSLVERLHPTPAVGGVPTRDAVRFIVENERDPRGWYASPVGWFDATGDGEFVVALRSGVFEGNRAHLYAGGGIVGDSDPASEYAETRMKLAALSTALHVSQ